VSPDPELFLNRVDLLGAYSMIEPLFIATDRDGQAAYTPMGQRHVRLLEAYATHIGRLAGPLSDDCARFRPVAGAYSPYGVLYGFSTDLLEHMAFKTLQSDTATAYSLEDVFASGDAHTLAWVSGWRKLPHLSPDVQRLFDYPQQFAEDVFERIVRALQRRASGDGATVVTPTGRFVATPPNPSAGSVTAMVPDERQLLSDRREGKYLVCYQTPGGWAAISKSVLTDVLGAGRDASVADLPPAAFGALTLACPGLVATP
jgi:hypothetical protein